MSRIIFYGRSFILISSDGDAAAVVLWGKQEIIVLHLSCPQIAANAEQFRELENL